MSFPRVMYLRCNFNSHAVKINAIRETSRSYVTQGRGRREGMKYGKREFTPITEAEYEEILWANKHCYEIASRIYRYQRLVDPATLRRIAELIGYTEGNANA